MSTSRGMSRRSRTRGRYPVRTGRGLGDHRGNRVLRSWIAAFLGFFLLGGAWAIAMPIDGNTDELQHIERAYGAADLQFLAPKSVALYGRAGAIFSVPRSLIPPNSMCMYMADVPNQQSIPAVLAEKNIDGDEHGAECIKPAGKSRERIKVTSYTGRYSPVYYLPVGIPMLIRPTEGGIVAGRLVSAALSAALLACAVAVAAWMRNRLLVAAVLVSGTPMVIDLMGAINPSGLEITAGVAFWAALLALCRAPREDLEIGPAGRRIVALATVSGALLLTVRGLGPLWAFLIVLCCLAVARKGALRELVRRRDIQVSAAVLVVVGIGGIAYNVAAGGYDWYPGMWPPEGPFNKASDLARTFLDRVDEYLMQAIGFFGYSDVRVPGWVITLWYMMLAAVLLPGLLRAARRHVCVIVGVVVLALGVTFALDVKYAHLLSWSQYSRYFLPFAVGAWLTAAAVTPKETFGGSEERRLPWLLLIASVLAQLWSLALAMTRFQAIDSPVNPFHGKWIPIWGSYAPVLAMALGLVALGWLCAVAPSALPGRGLPAVWDADEQAEASTVVMR